MVRIGVATRPQAEAPEFGGDVAGCLLELRARRRPAQHRVVGEDTDALAHVAGRDGVGSALDRRGCLRRQDARDEQQPQTEKLTHGWILFFRKGTES